MKTRFILASSFLLIIQQISLIAADVSLPSGEANTPVVLDVVSQNLPEELPAVIPSSDDKLFADTQKLILDDLAAQKIAPLKGNTVLHNAVMTGKVDLVEKALFAFSKTAGHQEEGSISGLLLKKNDDGQTAYDLAVESGQGAIADYLAAFAKDHDVKMTLN